MGEVRFDFGESSSIFFVDEVVEESGHTGSSNKMGQE